MASRPDGDVWNIVDNDKDSQHYGRNFKFDFSYISSKEIKDVVKDYVWQNYRVGNKTLSTLYNEISSYFWLFIQYCRSREIDTLRGIIELVYIVLQSVVKPGITGFFKIDLHIKCYIYLS